MPKKDTEVKCEACEQVVTLLEALLDPVSGQAVCLRCVVGAVKKLKTEGKGFSKPAAPPRKAKKTEEKPAEKTEPKS